MTAITQQVLVEAVLHLERLSFAARQQLADEIYAQQPNLLASIVVLQQYGATLEQMESVLNLLLVWYEAMQRSGRSWPLITEDDQDRCLQRICARARFTEGLSAQQQNKVVADFIAAHSEPQLLAYAYGKLGEYDWLRVNSELQKYLVLSTLNLVECIADTAPKTGTRLKQRRLAPHPYLADKDAV